MSDDEQRVEDLDVPEQDSDDVKGGAVNAFRPNPTGDGTASNLAQKVHPGGANVDVGKKLGPHV